MVNNIIKIGLAWSRQLVRLMPHLQLSMVITAEKLGLAWALHSFMENIVNKLGLARHLVMVVIFALALHFFTVDIFKKVGLAWHLSMVNLVGAVGLGRLLSTGDIHKTIGLALLLSRALVKYINMIRLALMAELGGGIGTRWRMVI